MNLISNYVIMPYNVCKCKDALNARGNLWIRMIGREIKRKEKKSNGENSKSIIEKLRVVYMY